MTLQPNAREIAFEVCNKAKCRVYKDSDGVGATLPAGVFLVWSLQNTC